MRSITLASLLMATSGSLMAAPEQKPFDVMCAHAPSQSKVISMVNGTTKSTNAAIAATLAVTGTRVVAHGSGAYILTGSSGYVAGTLGAAGAIPTLVTIGVVVGGVITAIELVCVDRNHPELVARVKATGKEFSDRLQAATKQSARATSVSITPVLKQTALQAKSIRQDVFDYVNRASIDFQSWIARKF